MATLGDIRNALVSDAIRQLRWEWYKQRIDQVHQRISAFDLLRRNGVAIRQATDTRPEQIQCPFHGQDNRPSARVYPDSTQSPSHVWCYVCRKRWDVIGLQKEFTGYEFSPALTSLEKLWGLTVPEMPEEIRGKHTEETDFSLAEFDNLYRVCETRLVGAREAYRQLEDLTGFLSANIVLDRVYHKVTGHEIPAVQGVEILKTLLDKIGIKMRASNV